MIKEAVFEGGNIMNQEEKEARLAQLQLCLKKRDLLKIREFLTQNLEEAVEDKAFLTQCYDLVKEDPIVFQPHNQELLDYEVSHWTEEEYEQFMINLHKNYSRKRYHLAMELALYFYAQKIAKEKEMEEKLTPKKKKKAKKVKPKRNISIQEKYKLTGVGTTAILLLAMVIQLVMNGE